MEGDKENSRDDDNCTSTTEEIKQTPVALAVAATPALSIASMTGGLAKLGALFRTDEKKENEGTWMPVAEGVEIRIRSQQSDQAREVSKRLLARFKAAFSVGASLSQAQNKEFEIAFGAEGLVTDWRGFDDGEQPLACTVENVRMLLTELPHLRRQVFSYAEQLDNYRPDPK